MPRFGPIDPIAWMIGHLAWQEQAYWLERWKREPSKETPGTKLPDFVGSFGASPYRPEC